MQLNSIARINLVSLLFHVINPLLLPCVHDSLLNVKHESTKYYHAGNGISKEIILARKPSIPFVVNMVAMITKSHLKITAMTNVNNRTQIL